MTRFTSLCFLLFLCFRLHVFSQPLPARYGKVDTADLKMKVYALDTSAAAVVLCNFGSFNTNEFSFTHLIRIKVLKKEGALYVNRIIRTPGKSMIRGITFNYVNGKVVESKLKEESIFREMVINDYERFRVTMPDVVDGSVIDLEYKFYGLPYEWRFQDVIPVRWSELRIPTASFFSFHKVYFGFEPLCINETGRWAGKDMPALHEEPYMNSITNYLTKIELELSEATISGSTYVKHFAFSSSWNSVNTFFLEHDKFGTQIKDPGIYLNLAVRNISDTCSSPLSKMIAAYQFIQKLVKWNKENSIFTSTNLYTISKNQSGNSAEVNLMLIKLLKRLNLEVYPVGLSTRDNGIISPAFPTIQKMNYVIALVKIDGKSYFLDATEEKLPPGILPERCLNGNGRIIDDKQSSWVKIEPGGQNKKVVIGKYTLGEDLIITGSMKSAEYDYAALAFRKDYESYPSHQEYLIHLESAFPGLTVDSLSVENLKDYNLPVIHSFNFSLQNQVDNLGSLISLNPLLFLRKTASPFLPEKRKFPVDYAFPIDEKYVLHVDIPEGYVVEEVPKTVNLMLPENKGRFKYLLVPAEKSIQLNVSFAISEVVFLENEYDLLREFYKQVISKMAENIILKKN